MVRVKRIISYIVLIVIINILTVISSENGVSASKNVIISESAIEHTYKVFEEGKKWEDAKTYCESMGGHLVTITSQEEQDKIVQLLGKANRNSYWIGGYRFDNEWRWVTGEKFEYSEWAPNQPDNNTYTSEIGEDSLMVYRNQNPMAMDTYLGSWNDLYNDGTCGNESFFGLDNVGYICEWDYSVTLSDSKIQLYKGNSAFLTCAVTDTSGNYIDASATYKSDNLSVAKVSSQGKIVAVGAGAANITVKIKGISKTCKVIVRPQKVSGIKAIFRTKNSIQLKWKKQSNISKYQILMYDKDLGEYTVVKSVNGKINSAIIKRLKKNKKYKFKIRAAIKSDGKNYYGDYSKVYKSKTSK